LPGSLHVLHLNRNPEKANLTQLAADDGGFARELLDLLLIWLIFDFLLEKEYD